MNTPDIDAREIAAQTLGDEPVNQLNEVYKSLQAYDRPAYAFPVSGDKTTTWQRTGDAV